MLAAEKLEMQSVGLTSIKADSIFFNGKNSIQQKTSTYLVNSATIGLKGSAEIHVLSTSNIKLDGSNVLLQQGAPVVNVADLDDTTGSINLPTPPAHEVGHSADVKPDPTPGNIGGDHIDDATTTA
jgi:hypothetical protein